jgi:uncharacterized membrane protein
MPYAWTEDRDGPQRLRLWPHQSLTAGGLAAFIGLSALLLALPLVNLVGSGALWIVLGFMAVVLGGAWAAIGRNRRAMGLVEELSLAPARIDLVRRDPGRPERTWAANPYWVELRLTPQGGPVPDYLTLRGAGREVELGAFLTREERVDLHRDLAGRLARLPDNGPHHEGPTSDHNPPRRRT